MDPDNRNLICVKNRSFFKRIQWLTIYDLVNGVVDRYDAYFHILDSDQRIESDLYEDWSSITGFNSFVRTAHTDKLSWTGKG